MEWRSIEEEPKQKNRPILWVKYYQFGGEGDMVPITSFIGTFEDKKQWREDAGVTHWCYCTPPPNPSHFLSKY